MAAPLNLPEIPLRLVKPRRRPHHLAALAFFACSRFGPVYPTRPAPSLGAATADPPPARVVAHLAMTKAALTAALDAAAARSGEGTFPFLGSSRRYAWDRAPLDVSLSQGRIVLRTRVHAVADMPLRQIEAPLDLKLEAEPVVGSEYVVKLQSIDVHVTSEQVGLAFADRLAGVYDTIAKGIAAELEAFAYDLKPLIAEAYARIERPIALPLGDAQGCAELRVLEIEAGPTVLADGIEKDLALIVEPSITLPCTDAGETPVARLPALSNVSTLPSGPFTVTVPIAASYDELARAMSAAFTRGRLYFSAEHPDVYLERPEVYESDQKLVLKLHIAGPVHELGIDSDLDGDLYLVGHPVVVDNELSLPDLEPTIETRNFLLSLKALTDADRIRDEARHTLRLDISARLRDVRGKLGDGLTFAAGPGCFRGEVDRIEVTGVYPHAAYLRVYVSVTARARVSMPCDDASP
jgi:hypothetical protein